MVKLENPSSSHVRMPERTELTVNEQRGITRHEETSNEDESNDSRERLNARRGTVICRGVRSST